MDSGYFPIEFPLNSTESLESKQVEYNMILSIYSRVVTTVGVAALVIYRYIYYICTFGKQETTQNVQRSPVVGILRT